MNNDPTVFVIDDDIAICKSIRWLLESVKLKVEIHFNAQSFLNAYNYKRKGCLLIDVRMPDVGGLELQEILNEKNDSLPIILMTGHGDINMAVRAMKMGAVDFITKPFDEQMLLEKIQKAIKDNANKITRSHQLYEERFNLLTLREREVAQNIVAGKPNKVVANELNISIKTVELHRGHIMKKMKAKNLAELVRMHTLKTCKI